MKAFLNAAAPTILLSPVTAEAVFYIYWFDTSI